MSTTEYRVTVVSPTGVRINATSERRTIRTHADAQQVWRNTRDLYDWQFDVYIEQRVVPVWERIEPLVPINQPKLPI